MRAIDFAHAASTNFFDDAVMGNSAANQSLRFRHLVAILGCVHRQVNEPNSEWIAEKLTISRRTHSLDNQDEHRIMARVESRLPTTSRNEYTQTRWLRTWMHRSS